MKGEGCGVLGEGGGKEEERKGGGEERRKEGGKGNQGLECEGDDGSQVK